MAHHPLLMKMANGPPAAGGGIITSDLVLHLDAGNSSSYPGSGTDWFDLSAESNDQSFVNLATWGSAAGGHFDFDGVNDYSSGSSTNFPSGAAASTIQMWLTVDSAPGGFISAFSYGTASLGEARGIVMNSSTEFVAAGYGVDVVATSAATVGQWYNVAFVYTGTVIELYIDGSLDNSSTETLSTTLNLCYVGEQVNDLGEYWDGKISQILVYDVALSATQILANYNATSSRYP